MTAKVLLVAMRFKTYPLWEDPSHALGSYPVRYRTFRIAPSPLTIESLRFRKLSPQDALSFLSQRVLVQPR